MLKPGIDPDGAGVSRIGPPPGRLCIFSHYDPQSVVRDYVHEYLTAISSVGYRIWFVSATRDLPGSERERLRPIVEKVLVRENSGYDFGSWQFALSQIEDTSGLDWLLLANDSVFGPFFEFSNLFRRMESSEADFWGITDSYEVSWHLQSYFMAFKSEVVRSRAFRDFFQGDFSRWRRWEVVSTGEIALSRDLVRAGFTGLAACPYDALDEREYSGARNPTYYYWDKLIEKFNCPVLKVKLLRDNPDGIPNIDRWRTLLSSVSSYDTGLIEDYLCAFGEAPSGPRPMRAFLSHVGQLPYVSKLILRAAGKALRSPRQAVMSLERFVAEDRS